MPVTVKRRDIRFSPDPRRVIARFFVPGDHERSRSLVKKVLALPESQVELIFNQVLRNFSRRHRNVTKIFENHYKNVQHLFEALDILPDTLSLKRKLLIGSYFSMEYSIEK